MLRILWGPQLSSKRSVWDRFDPNRQQWVVSDLKSKVVLSEKLLKSYGVIGGDPILRATEFWRSLLHLHQPQWRVLQQAGSLLLAKDFLGREEKFEWCKRPRAAQKLLSESQVLSSLVTHPECLEVMTEYKSAFKNEQDLFSEIVDRGHEFFNFCVWQKKLPWFFVPIFLARWPQDVLLEKELIFDLGHGLTIQERDLIQDLATKHMVTVIVPAKDREDLVEQKLWNYRDLDLGIALVEEELVESHEVKATSPILWRCSSPAKEARRAAGAIGELVRSGVPPYEIAVCAQNPKEYASVLNNDLFWEGVPSSKGLVGSLGGVQVFRQMGAQLKIATGQLEAPIVSEAFGLNKKQTQSLGPVTEPRNISIKWVREKITELRKSSNQLVWTREQFENLIVELFGRIPGSGEFNNELVSLLQGVRVEIGHGEFQLKHWVDYWFRIVAKKNVGAVERAAAGVHLVDLDGIEDLSVKYLFLLGQVEPPTDYSVTTTLNSEKIEFLKNLGFDFGRVTRSESEGKVDRILKSSWNRLVFSTCDSDSSGKAVSANKLWLRESVKQNGQDENYEPETSNTWDRLQRNLRNPQNLARFSDFKELDLTTFEKVLSMGDQDLNGTRRTELGARSTNPFPYRLSVSKIEEYWKCAFRFFASTGLTLRDDADIDLEPTPAEKGQWLHKAIEEITGSDRDLSQWTDGEIEELLRESAKKFVGAVPDMWKLIHSKYVRILKKFIEFERQWQSHQKEFQIAGIEASVEGSIQWDSSQLSFSSGEPSGEVGFRAPFKGKIDRIDSDGKGMGCIVDYKSSDGSISNFSSWTSKGSFQLALYSQALESGLSDIKFSKVTSAQYFSLKSFDRSKGFHLKTPQSEMQNGFLQPSKKSLLEEESRTDLFQKINQEVGEVLEAMAAGDWTTNPKKKEYCQSCSWRRLCRNPKLQ